MLTAADINIGAAVQFSLSKMVPDKNPTVFKGPGGFQNPINISFVGMHSEKSNINFQFPPRITSDGRSGTWSEKEVPGDQAISIYKTSGARKFNLEWTYIIGESGSSAATSQPWTAADIRKNLGLLRAYYSQVMTTGTEYIVAFKYGYHGDTEQYFTCRLSTIDITHKGGLIMEGSGKLVFPLRSDVKVAMQLWTRGARARKEGEADDKDDSKFKIDGLFENMTAYPLWE